MPDKDKIGLDTTPSGLDTPEEVDDAVPAVEELSDEELDAALLELDAAQSEKAIKEPLAKETVESEESAQASTDTEEIGAVQTDQEEGAAQTDQEEGAAQTDDEEGAAQTDDEEGAAQTDGEEAQEEVAAGEVAVEELPPPRKLERKWKVLIGIAAAFVVVVGALLTVAFTLDLTPNEAKAAEVMQDGTMCAGITIQGVDVGGMTLDQARKALDDSGVLNPDLATLTVVSTDGKEWTIQGSVLDATTPYEDVLREAMLVDKSGTFMDQWGARNEITTNGRAYTLTTGYNQAKLDDALEAIVQEITVQPKNPGVYIDDETEKLTIDDTGEDGQTVDVANLIADATARMKAMDYGTLEMQYTVLPPAINQDVVNEMVQIAKYTSPCSGSDNRRYNVRKACQMISGNVIMPGETFSINDTLGDRYTSTGWKEAPGIINGNTTSLQAGGGVCQVSSTLYCSALLADMTVTVRRHHSWPASYMPIGLDATISTGGPDLCFVNETDNPVVIIAYTTDGTSYCTVKFYGTARTDGLTVELDAEVISSWSPPASIPGPTNITARTGYKAEAYRNYVDEDGNVVDSEFLHVDTYDAVQGRYSSESPKSSE